MIQLNNITLSFGTQTIFEDLSVIIDAKDRIGLVGRNGSGKTTLLKLIAKQISIDNGSFSVMQGKSIGYLPQEITLNSEKTILEEVAHARQLLDECEYEAIKAEAKKILTGLGFSLEQIEKEVNTLSIGWKMRVLLAQLLMKQADFYLFDEPTNHLDIVTKQWFLHFLQNASFGFLLVSHDRYFLNHVCSKTFEIEQKKGTMYQGNYEIYQQQKEKNVVLQQKKQEEQQKEIAKKTKTIERFRASASKSKMAKSMEKKLSKMKVESPLHTDHTHVKISLPPPPKANRMVLKATNLAHVFDNRNIFKNVSFELERGEKVALLAANGMGKTTLLSILIGTLKRQHGSIAFGDRVELGYFEQNQDHLADAQKTILQSLEESAPTLSFQQLRAILGAFLFTGDSIEKKIGVLSGGEKNRISMAKILAHKNNTLLLDEPTNHLDMQSKEVLLKALQAYPGTILFVSHDQYFINKLATRILELTPNGAYSYPGNYEDYCYQKEPAENSKNIQKPEKKKNEDKISSNQYEQQKEQRKLERKIENLEKEMANLGKSLEHLPYGSPEFKKRYTQLTTLQKEHQQLLMVWEKLITLK